MSDFYPYNEANMPVPPTEPRRGRRPVLVLTIISVVLLLAIIGAVSVSSVIIPYVQRVNATNPAIARAFPFSATQILNDPLTKPNSTWAQDYCTYANGSYQAIGGDTDTILCSHDTSYPTTDQEGFSYEITIQSLQGSTTGIAGIVFSYG